MNKLIGIGLLCSLVACTKPEDNIRQEWEKPIQNLNAYLYELLDKQDYGRLNSFLIGAQLVEESFIEDPRNLEWSSNDPTPLELRYNQTIFYYGRKTD